MTLPLPAVGDGLPRRVGVYRQLLGAIRTGQLAPGARLPSARELARAWTVPRGAVDNAFAQLVNEGLIERRVGSGSFVQTRLPQAALRARAAEPAVVSNDPVAAMPLLRPLATDISSFPLAVWRRHVGRAMAGADRSLLSYGAAGGLDTLRAAVARYLRLTRSIDCAPGQVLIVNSALHAIDLIAQVLLEPGARVAVEDPGFPGVSNVLRQARLNVVPVPVDAMGFDAEAAAQLAGDAAAIYLHPLNQYPTGWRTGAARRRALLEHADGTGAWIIEGDHIAEIAPGGAAPPALWRSDRAGRVLYVGSFNGVMFPSLRLGFLLVPEALVPVFSAVRGMLGDHSPVAMQAALASFIDAGQLSAHLRQLRALYDSRRRVLLAAVARELGERVRVGPTDAGIHACLHLPLTLPDHVVAAALARRGVEVEALSTLCSLPRGHHGWCHNGLVLGYGGNDEEEIARGVTLIAQVLDAMPAATGGPHAW